jgi:DNA ligase-associated metallophosphoesterase
MAEIRTKVADTPVVVDSSGALFLPASRTLVVADLHLEKASAFARRGTFLPPYDTGATLILLAALMLKRTPRRVVSLGDSFHDSDGYARLSEPDRWRLAALQRGCEWIWITGNHDPMLPPGIEGEVAAEVALEGLTFRHAPLEGKREGEVAGHLHPAAKVRGRGRSVRCRAFATDGERMVLPAFGVLTGGLNVLDQAFSKLFSGALSRALLIGNGKLFPVAFAALSPD